MINIQPFLDNYKNKQYLSPNLRTWDVNQKEIDYLFSNFGGLSINLGVFKIHTFESAKKWTEILEESFPKYRGKIISFGFDWLGRQYSKDTVNEKIYMFDGSTGEDFELEQTLESFFNQDLVEYGIETLSSDNFESWNTEKLTLKHNEIVAFKIPLVLGGKDKPTNYQISDAEVDWEINRQLLEK